MSRDLLIRREFLETALKLSASAWGFSVLGCSFPRRSPGLTGVNDAKAETKASIKLRDIAVIALYSDGTQGPQTGVIRATDIRDGKPVTLDHWDGHGHKYTVTLEHYGILKKAGPAFKIETTTALNHNHLVLIDRSNQIASSPEIEISLDPTTPPPPAGVTPSPTPSGGASADRIYGALAPEAEPRMIVAGSSPLKEGSVEYCLESLEKCSGDNSLWNKFSLNSSTGLQSFRTETGLKLDTGLTEIPLTLRGRLASDDRLIYQLLKLRRK